MFLKLERRSIRLARYSFHRNHRDNHRNNHSRQNPPEVTTDDTLAGLPNTASMRLPEIIMGVARVLLHGLR